MLNFDGIMYGEVCDIKDNRVGISRETIVE